MQTDSSASRSVQDGAPQLLSSVDYDLDADANRIERADNEGVTISAYDPLSVQTILGKELAMSRVRTGLVRGYRFATGTTDPDLRHDEHIVRRDDATRMSYPSTFGRLFLTSQRLIFKPMRPLGVTMPWNRFVELDRDSVASVEYAPRWRTAIYITPFARAISIRTGSGKTYHFHTPNNAAWMEELKSRGRS